MWYTPFKDQDSLNVLTGRSDKQRKATGGWRKKKWAKEAHLTDRWKKWELTSNRTAPELSVTGEVSEKGIRKQTDRLWGERKAELLQRSEWTSRKFNGGKRVRQYQSRGICLLQEEALISSPCLGRSSAKIVGQCLVCSWSFSYWGKKSNMWWFVGF